MRGRLILPDRRRRVVKEGPPGVSEISGVDEGDGVDFHGGAQGKGGHLDGGPGRSWVAIEIASVDGIDSRKKRKVCQVHRGPHNSSQGAAAFFKDSGQVCNDLFGLGLDLAADDLSGPGVDGDLTRRKEPSAMGHPLGVGPYGLRSTLAPDLRQR